MSQDEHPKGFRVADRRHWVEAEDGTNGAESNGAESGTTQSGEFPSYVEQLRAELADRDRQLREYIAAYKEQIVQGVEETKARLARENERELERMRGRLIEELLDVLDNLDRSLAAARESPSVDALIEGVSMVREQFSGKLAALGLAKLEAVGQKFDPRAHEAIGLVPVSDPAQDGTVVAEIKSGYKLGDRVLRPALVQVGKAA